MLSTSSKVRQPFLEDVAVYADFLENWFSPERWSSCELARPLRSGVLTSAEIAYVLLRFGRFQTGDWEAWKTGGFVALDTAINTTMFEVKGLLRHGKRTSSAGLEATASTEDAGRLQGPAEVLTGERLAQTSLSQQSPLLCALAFHLFLNIERVDTDVVTFCRRLNLIVA